MPATIATVKIQLPPMIGKYLTKILTNSFRQTMRAIGAKHLSETNDIYSNYDVIGIDEGQFFPDVSTQTTSFWFQTLPAVFEIWHPFSNSVYNHHIRMPSSFHQCEMLACVFSVLPAYSSQFLILVPIKS